MNRSMDDCLVQARKSRKSILSICLSPGIQHTYILQGYHDGEVNRAKASYVDAAGKGINVCRALAQLGIPNMHLSQGGANSSSLEAMARREGLRLAQIPSSRPMRTCSTLVVLDEAAEIPESGVLEELVMAGRIAVDTVTEIVEEAAAVDDGVQERLLAEYETLLSQTSLVCISGSRAPGYGVDCVAELVRRAHDHAVPVFLDVRSDDLLSALREEPVMIKINLDEFLLTFIPQHAKLYATLDAKNATEHLAAVKEVLADLTEYGATSIVITRGPRHVLVASGGEVREIAIPRMSKGQLVNPIGSGDAFLAGMAAIWSGTDERDIQDDTLRSITRAVDLGIRCGQASARTLRPAMLPEPFLAELLAGKPKN